MPDPTRSHSLEAWCDARPLDRKIVSVRMAGRWVVALVDETGEPRVGSGRSLHDAIEAAQDELDSAARRVGLPPQPARRVAVSLVADTEVFSAEHDTREVDAELRAELLEATLPSEVPEFCSCGRNWPWTAGIVKGIQNDGVDRYAVKNCPYCGTTRMRVLAPQRVAPLARLGAP